MPFKFEVELETADSKSLWTRSIYSLSTVSDIIKFTIRQQNDDDDNNHSTNSWSEILLTSVNITKTSCLTCSFKFDFFKTFKIEGELPNSANGDDDNQAKSFSILINSKNLNVLFKDCGENSEIFKILILHDDNSETNSNACNKQQQGMHSIPPHAPPVSSFYMNKLFIEFKTRNEMTKKYSLNFRLGYEMFDLKIISIYQSLLYDQILKDRMKNDPESTSKAATENDNSNEEEEHADRVHQLTIDTKILKKFLQMFPTAIEDFKIEVIPGARKLILHGFNRQEVLTSKKTSNLATLPMNLTILISLNDLASDNFQITPIENESGEKVKYVNSFRLRDFKTFIQLVSYSYLKFGSESPSTNYNSNTQRNVNDYDLMLSSVDSSLCELMFSMPGSPVVFDRKYQTEINAESITCAAVMLIVISDAEVDKIKLPPNQHQQHHSFHNNNTNSNFALKSVVQPIQSNTNDSRHKRQRSAIHHSLSIAQNQQPIDYEDPQDPQMYKKQQQHQQQQLVATSEHANSTNEPLFVPVDGHDNEDGEDGQSHGSRSSTVPPFKSPLRQGNNLSESLLFKESRLFDKPSDTDHYGQEQDGGENDEDIDSIFWDNARFHRVTPANTTISINNNKAHGDVTVDDNLHTDKTTTTKKTGIDVDGNEIEVNMLGPTQNVPRVKGIFD